jgi:hypothetical protein
MTRNEAADNIRSMREYKRKVVSSKGAAIAALREAGILTLSGEVAEPYRSLLGDNPGDPVLVVQE